MISAHKIRKRMSCRGVPFFSNVSLCKNSSENQIYNQISLPNQGTILYITPPPGKNDDSTKRAALCSLSKASLTVEAALSLPLFFMTVICLVSIINVYGMTLEKAASLRDISEVSATASGLSSEDLYIDINVPFVFTPYCLPEGIASVTIPCKAYVRAWNGRDEDTTAKGKDKSGGTYVYVTESGTVYHTSPDCTHIDLSIKTASKGALDSMRNEYGGKYHACEKCEKEGFGSLVYVTGSGDAYHNSASCSGLKRTVKMVDQNELDGMKKCSRCEKNE